MEVNRKVLPLFILNQFTNSLLEIFFPFWLKGIYSRAPGDAMLEVVTCVALVSYTERCCVDGQSYASDCPQVLPSEDQEIKKKKVYLVNLAVLYELWQTWRDTRVVSLERSHDLIFFIVIVLFIVLVHYIFCNYLCISYFSFYLKKSYFVMWCLVSNILSALIV